MALFSKLNDLAKTLGTMAGEVIENTQRKDKAEMEEQLALEEIRRLGELIYLRYEQGEELDGEVLEICKAINGHRCAAQAEREAAEAERRALEEAESAEETESEGVVCPKCGKNLEAGAKFCSGCGAKIEEKQDVFCPECGKQLSPDARFCGGCGRKMTE